MKFWNERHQAVSCHNTRVSSKRNFGTNGGIPLHKANCQKYHVLTLRIFPYEVQLGTLKE